MLKIGERAPDFLLPDQNGHMTKLSQLWNKSVLVVYFYPRDNTPGCTKESCSFRDNYDAYKKLGAEIIGISADEVVSHEEFAKKYSLPFLLLSDNQGRAAKLYQVNSAFGLIPGRVTYVIDSKGVIRHAHSSQINIESHIDKTLQVLRSLQYE